MSDWHNIREQTRASILFLRVRTSDREGRNAREDSATGFIVNAEGYVVTAAHVWPAETKDLRVEAYAHFSPQYSEAFRLNLVKADRDVDVAVLRLPPAPPGRPWQPLTFTSSATVPDEAAICVLGFPLGQELSFAEGRVSNRFGHGGRFQTTLPLNPGYSGSPVFDISGRIIGVAAGGFERAQQVTHVTPSDYLRSLILLAGPKFEKGPDGYAPVYSIFKPIHAALPDLGSPRAAAELSDDSYQAAYDNAHIIWIKQLLCIFVLPTDHNRKATHQHESHWTTEKDLFNDDKLRLMFGEPPQGKYPPHGGVAFYWRRDPDSWKWIGWRQWFCRYFNEAYFQEFENGDLFTSIPRQTTRKYSQFSKMVDGSPGSRAA